MSRIASIVTLALALFLAPPSAQAPDTEPEPSGPGPSTLIYRVSRIVEGREEEAGKACRALVARIAERHADTFRLSTYEEMGVDDDRVYSFGDCMDGKDSNDWFQAYQGDGEWKQLLNEVTDLIPDERVTRFVLLAGRPPSGKVRGWRLWMEGRAHLGSYGSACAFARELVEYLDEHHPGVGARAYVANTGELGRIGWLADFGSPGEWERLQARLVRDPAYLAIFERAQDAFVEGSLERRFLDLAY